MKKRQSYQSHGDDGDHLRAIYNGYRYYVTHEIIYRVQQIDSVITQLWREHGLPELRELMTETHLLEDRLNEFVTTSVDSAETLVSRKSALGVLVDRLLLDGSRVVEHSSPIDKPIGFFVYALFDSECSTPVYVGQSTNWAGRIGSHVNDPSKQWHYFRVIEVESLVAMEELEAQLINLYRPKYNKKIPPPPCGYQRFDVTSFSSGWDKSVDGETWEEFVTRVRPHLKKLWDAA